MFSVELPLNVQLPTHEEIHNMMHVAPAKMNVFAGEQNKAMRQVKLNYCPVCGMSVPQEEPQHQIAP